jgi:hypothetical protein
MRRNLALFFFFALVATLCDLSWFRLHTLRYPHDTQPWWTPLMFGVVGLAAVHFAALTTRYLVRSDAPRPADPPARFAVSAAWFVAAYLACGLFDATRARRLAVALVLIWLVRFILQWPRKGERLAVLIICIGLAAAGSGGEMLLVRFHIMAYVRPFRLGIPLWLPGLYLQAGYLGRDIARIWFGGR